MGVFYTCLEVSHKEAPVGSLKIIKPAISSLKIQHKEIKIKKSYCPAIEVIIITSVVAHVSHPLLKPWWFSMAFNASRSVRCLCPLLPAVLHSSWPSHYRGWRMKPKCVAGDAGICHFRKCQISKRPMVAEREGRKQTWAAREVSIMTLLLQRSVV